MDEEMASESDLDDMRENPSYTLKGVTRTMATATKRELFGER